MPLVKNGALAADLFVAVADGEPLPDGPVIVSAARLLADGPALIIRNGEIGVAWPNDKDVAELQPFLSRLSLITLAFPKFRDGRAYSQARLLRERYGYKGELRAVGNVSARPGADDGTRRFRRLFPGEGGGRGGLRQGGCHLFRLLPAHGRPPPHRARRPHRACGHRGIGP